MKVGICALNSKYIHSSLAPWYLLAGLEEYCTHPVEAEVVEGTINQLPEDILSRLCDGEYDLLGFCCYIWNITRVKELVREYARRHPDTIIVLGGPEVSFTAGEILRELSEVDYVIAGEGEKPFSRLVDVLRLGQEMEGIPGLCYRVSEGETHQNPAEFPSGDPPSPYTDGYFDALQGRIAYLESSRGCPFSCSFCLSGGKDSVRFFQLETAKQNLLRLANSGSRTVKFVDRTFNCNLPRAKELLRFLIDRQKQGDIPDGVCFHFEIAADLFDGESLDIIATAPPGLFQFEAGLQSFHPPTLRRIGRPTDQTRLLENLRRLVDMKNCHLHIDLIAGLPEEDVAAFEKSFCKGYALRPHMLQLGFLKMLHGSRIRREAAGDGYRFSPNPPYEVWGNRWMGEEELRRLGLVEDTLERLYNSGRFRRTLDYLEGVLPENSYRMFLHFGEYLAEREDAVGMSLDRYTEWVYRCFSRRTEVDAGLLRDWMVCDRLAVVNTGKLPACLRVEDKRLSVAAARLRRQREGRLGTAILYHARQRLAVADYSRRDPVTGDYPLEFLPMEEWI